MSEKEDELCEKFRKMAEQLHEKFDKASDGLVKTMRWYLTFIFGIVVLFASVTGYVVVDHFSVKNNLQKLKEDLSLSIKADAMANPNNLFYQYLDGIYNPSRGGKKDK